MTYKGRARLTVAGEVFNALEIANLQLAGYNFLLGTPTFGQATTRIIQTLGSGGPQRVPGAANQLLSQAGQS